jgi:hypothetical protein
MQEFRWDKGGNVRLKFLYRKGNEYHQKREQFLHHKAVSAVKRVEFVGGRMTYSYVSSPV